jgi:hypothetical protein
LLLGRSRCAEADRRAVAGLFRRDLHDDAVAERAERLQVELGGADNVAHIEADMVDHHYPPL